MKDIHADLYKNEERYWWSIVRRRLALSMWRRFSNPELGYNVLDAGCGAGALLSALNKYVLAYGIDSSFKACEFSRSKNNNVLQADILRLPFKDNSFAGIFALDLIEHIEDEAAFIRQIYRVCRKGGLFILTAPAFKSLWGKRDEYLGHKRRYTVRQLQSLLTAAGFKMIKCSYIYALLFPVLYFRNKISSCLGLCEIKTDVFAVPAALNKILVGLFSIETRLLGYLSFPMGSSVICVAKKD